MSFKTEVETDGDRWSVIGVSTEQQILSTLLTKTKWQRLRPCLIDDALVVVETT